MPEVRTFTSDILIKGRLAATGLSVFSGTVVLVDADVVADTYKAGPSAAALPASFTAAHAITTHAFYGFQDYSVISNPTAIAVMGHASFSVRVELSGADDINHHHAYQDASVWSGSGTLTTLSGVSVNQVVNSGVVTAVHGVRVLDPTMNGGVVTTNYGIRVAALTAGTTNYSVYTEAGLVRLGGPVGVGVTPASDRALWVKPAGTLTGTTQYGALIFPTVSSAATVAAYGINLGVQTTAAAYTVTTAYGLNIISPVIGAGSAITTNYALRIAAQTTGGTNYAIFTEAGLVQFGDTVTVGINTAAALLALNGPAASVRDIRVQTASVTRWAQRVDGAETGSDAGANLAWIATTDAGATIGTALALTRATMLATFGASVRVTGTVGVGAAAAADRGLFLKPVGTLTGTSQFGAVVFPTVSSAATVAAYGVNVAVETTAAAFTVTNVYGVNIGNPTLGAGSAITTNHGVYVAGQTSGGTNYAIYTNAGLVRFGDNVSGTGSIVSSSATAGVGYATGAGGTVAQGSGSGKATGVTLDKVTGLITMDAANLNAATVVAFTLTNSAIAATDTVVLQHQSGGTLGAYTYTATSAGGSALISVRNATAGNLAEAIVLRFTVIKSVSA